MLKEIAASLVLGFWCSSVCEYMEGGVMRYSGCCIAFICTLRLGGVGNDHIAKESIPRSSSVRDY